MNIIDIQTAKRIIYANKNEVMSAIFRKRTGEKELRKMIFRLGVKKGVKGVGMSYEPKKYNLVNVFDLEKNAFRMVNLDTLIQLKTKGTTYIIKHEEVK